MHTICTCASTVKELVRHVAPLLLQGQPQIRGMTCSTDAYGVHADFRLHNKPVNAMWEFSKVHLLPRYLC